MDDEQEGGIVVRTVRYGREDREKVYVTYVRETIERRRDKKNGVRQTIIRRVIISTYEVRTNVRHIPAMIHNQYCT